MEEVAPMAKKEPKTMRGIGRKILTGDGRKKSPAEKLVDEAFGIKKKRYKQLIEEIQSYIRKKGEQVTEIEVIQAGIRLAERLRAENWGIYLEVKHEYDKTFKEVR